MRKDYFVKVLATVQNTLNETMDGDAELSPEVLTEIAKAYGLVEGKRGRDGGFQATDKGLTFVGEDIQSFLVREAQENERRTEEAKKARKEAAAKNRAELKAQLSTSIKDAA